jgi:peptide/nickel transport system permease protein
MSRAGSLRGYVLVRIALMIPMVWVLLTVVFLMMRVAPGDPISATLGGKLSPAELAERQEALGFDRPLLVQYFEYLWDAVRLQFGTTITDGQTIGSIVVENGGATLTLTVAALIFALVIGLPLGLIAGRYRETIPDASSASSRSWATPRRRSSSACWRSCCSPRTWTGCRPRARRRRSCRPKRRR